MAFMHDQRVKDNIAKAEAELAEAVAQERPEQAPQISQKPTSPSDPNDKHDWKSRYGALQAYIEKTIKPAHKAEIDKLTSQITELSDKINQMVRAQSPANLPQTIEEVETMKKENPAAYHAIMKIAGDVAESLVADKLAELKRDVNEVKQFRKQTAEEAAFIELQRRHPDLDLIALNNDDEFNDWLDGKSKRIQAALRENKEDVDAASDVLALYKYEVLNKKQTPTTRKQPPEGFSDPAPKGQPNIPKQTAGWDFTESEIEEKSRMDQHWVEKNLEAIDKAWKAGRILLDISDQVGSARRMAAMGI